MYSETLITPHPNRQAENQQYLCEELQLEEISAYLAALKEGDREAYNHETAKAADAISKGVHRALWFKESTQGDPSLLTPESLSEEQTSNCYGYTIVLSECLEKAGIRHWVSFVNGHALTVVQPSKEADAWIIDALSPQLNAALGDSVSKDSIDGLDTQMAKYDRGAVKFSSGKFVSNLREHGSFQEIVIKHPWLSFEHTYESARRASDIDYAEHLHKQRTLVMSLFEPEQGRRMLVAHNKLTLALANNKRAQAYRSFKELKQLYPDVDIRNEPKDISLLVRELGSVGCIGMAARIVDETREGLSISQDPRHDVWQADMYRWLGNKARDTRLLQQSIAIYSQALTRAKHPETIVSKRSKAERLLARVATS